MNTLTLDLWFQYGLFALFSFFAGLTSTVVGFGGGILMLALLSGMVPIKELIAVICLVQMSTLVIRLYLCRKDADYGIAGYFLIGAIPGVILASLLFDAIASAALAVILGLFLLFSAAKPKGLPLGGNRSSISLYGAGITFFSMFVGAPGPALAGLLTKLELSKESYVATMAACSVAMNIVVLTGFYSIGFDIERWLLPCGIMIVTGIVGTMLGLRLIKVVNEKLVFAVVRIAMALAGINLVLS